MLSYLLQFLFDFRRPNNKRASHRILHSFYTWIHVFYCHKTLFCPLQTVISTCIFPTGRHCSHKIWPASELSAPISRPPAAPRNIPRVDNMINNWCKQKRSGHSDNGTLLSNGWQYRVAQSLWSPVLYTTDYFKINFILAKLSKVQVYKITNSDLWNTISI